MHLDEERLQRLLHGELSPLEEKIAREHVALCDDCRGRLGLAQGEEATTDARLRELDQSMPMVDFGSIAARARIEGRRPLAHRRIGRRAASLILAAGIAGAAYAIPGSPVRGWVDRVVTWISSSRGTAPATSHPTDTPKSGGAGIAVAPGRQLLILFGSIPGGGSVRVSLIDGDEVVVRASSPSATFTSGAGRILIESGASDSFEIEIPRTAPRVEILLRDTRLFLKDGQRIEAGAATDSSGVYVIRLTPEDS